MRKSLRARFDISFGLVPSFLLSFFLWLWIFSFEVAIAQAAGIYDNKKDEVAGVTALMSAVVSGDVDGVSFFSKAGKITINQKNLGGATALHLACREKNFEIAKILIENGADINAVDNEGWTPLMRSSLSGSAEIVDLLLKNGAQAAAVNSEGESAIIHAALSDCSGCLNLMFGGFDFINLMDVQLLKNQLTEAFIITKNHGNVAGQGLIEGYLDRVIKASPLTVKAPEINSEVNNINDSGAKVFKITPSVTNLNKVNKIQKTPQLPIPKEPEKTFIIYEEEKALPKSAQKTVLTPTPVIKNTVHATSSESKVVIPHSPQKFKFVTGPAATPVKENNPTPIYKIIETPKTKKTGTEPKQTSAKIFKFRKGPQGQVLESIVKEEADGRIAIELNKFE